MSEEKELKKITLWKGIRFGVPRACQGQIIEYAFAVDLYNEWAIMRVWDRSAPPNKDVTWYVCDLDWDELGELEGYDAGGSAYPPIPIDDPRWEQVEIEFTDEW